MFTVLDIFSGIGGFSLGLERTGGFKTVAFCEIDPFCRKVLRKHWPDVPIHEDVTKLRGEDVGPVDVIAGGFPCQDISTAGRGEGIEGSRSGLWKEFARLIGEIRPRYVIVENVSALLGRGLDRVLGDLAALGFDAEWHCMPASAVGAPHRRDRVWIVAFAQHPDTDRTGLHRTRVHECGSAESADEQERVTGPVGAFLADTDSTGQQDPEGRGADAWRYGNGTAVGRGRSSRGAATDADLQSLVWSPESWGQCGQWLTEPDVGRVAHGVPMRVDRLRSLGNAVVPQVVEVIGNAILESA